MIDGKGNTDKWTQIKTTTRAYMNQQLVTSDVFTSFDLELERCAGN